MVVFIYHGNYDEYYYTHLNEQKGGYMHSRTKTKKRNQRRRTHRKVAATKSVGDLPLCTIYISSVVILEALLVVMVILSTPRSNHVTAPVASEITQTSKAYNIDGNMAPKNLAGNVVTSKVETETGQSEVAKKDNLVEPKKSNVISNKDYLTKTSESKVADVEVASSKDDTIAMKATEKAKDEVEKSEKEVTKEKKVKKSDAEKNSESTTTVEVSTDENPNTVIHISTDITAVADARETDESAKTKNDTVVESDDVSLKSDVTDEEITEESLVGAEELVEETAETDSIETETEVKNTEHVARSADVDLLANIMYAEEGVFIENDPENAEIAHKLCGSVVLHRMEVNFGGATTMEEVLNAENQYAGATKRRIRNGQEIPEVVYKWAEELLTTGPIGPRNMVYQAQFKQGKVYDKIGNQYFCISDKFSDVPEVEEEMNVVPESEIIIEDSVEPQDSIEESLIYDDLYIEEYDI